MMMTNNRGFTAVEVMVGVGLAAVVTLAVVTTQVMVTKDQVKMRGDLEQSVDQLLAERILFVDFNGIDPSYNNVKVMDDNNLNFFDYYPDVPASSIKRLDRSITLRGDGNLSVSVVSRDLAAGSSMSYDPTAAYDIGAETTDFNVASSLTFNSLNKSNWISSPSLGNRPGFWADGMTLMLDTPAKIRPVSATGIVDMSIPPRSPIYVGYVSGQALLPLTGTDVAALFNTTQPDTGAAIPSADSFLRNAPSVGGGQTMVRLRAVKVIKYYLQPATGVTADCVISGSTKKYYHSNFYKVVYKKGAYSTPMLLADKVCGFEMHRDSVLKRMIYFRIVKVKDTEKDAGKTAGL